MAEEETELEKAFNKFGTVKPEKLIAEDQPKRKKKEQGNINMRLAGGYILAAFSWAFFLTFYLMGVIT